MIVSNEFSHTSETTLTYEQWKMKIKMQILQFLILSWTCAARW